MIFAITHDGVEVATVTADNLVFGKKLKSGSLTESGMVDDPKIFKMLVENGKTAFLVLLGDGYTAEPR